MPEGAHGNAKIRVRMYRQGLGDCFLLTFYGSEKPRHVLIDCGVLTGTPQARDKIRKVAQSVSDETGGKLDALAVTHEHWDHISGFSDAKDIFDPIQVGEIWVGWTEDPDQTIAKERKMRAGMQLQAVRATLAKLSAFSDTGSQERGAALAGTLGFWGPVEASSLGFSDQTGAAMDAVTKRQPKPQFWNPGDQIERDWLPGVRIYVLGPPKDAAMLNKELGKVGTDMYGLRGPGDAFFATALGIDSSESASAMPFDSMLQWRDTDSIRKHPNFGELLKRYEAEEWRRIDSDWLLSAARMALQLDSATNNTSLVLAFELAGSGKVLLFAADAQVGNWKSWAGLSWKTKDGTVTTEDVLKRTVFYKVGHHGSHNATLKTGGLESMTSPDLVAAIPVDQKFANNSKKWEMPADALYKRIKEKAKERVLRADWNWPTKDDPKPDPLESAEWQNFLSAVEIDPGGLFIDYYLS